eukprot:1195904-Prorocentrum_minimum.AAC.3
MFSYFTFDKPTVVPDRLSIEDASPLRQEERSASPSAHAGNADKRAGYDRYGTDDPQAAGGRGGGMYRQQGKWLLAARPNRFILRRASHTHTHKPRHCWSRGFLCPSRFHLHADFVARVHPQSPSGGVC